MINHFMEGRQVYTRENLLNVHPGVNRNVDGDDDDIFYAFIFIIGYFIVEHLSHKTSIFPFFILHYHVVS